MATSTLTTGQCATLACLLEVTAPKPGNVHRAADFEDLTFTDFAVSAALIGPAMERAVEVGVGRTVLEAMRATRTFVHSNTNLGILLLLAPLAAVPRQRPLGEGIRHVLGSLTASDAADVYQAIRLAASGSLGTVEQMDVGGEAPADLLAAMAAAARRDTIAEQYVNHFALVLDVVTPSLTSGVQRGWTLSQSIVHTHVRLLSEYSDTLIIRKCGPEIGRQAALRASRVLDCGGPPSEDYERALGELDFWLRSDGHRRNPGTTADLIAAGLFCGLRDGLLGTNLS